MKYVGAITLQGNLVQLGNHLVLILSRNGQPYIQLGALLETQRKPSGVLQMLCSQFTKLWGFAKSQCLKGLHKYSFNWKLCNSSDPGALLSTSASRGFTKPLFKGLHSASLQGALWGPSISELCKMLRSFQKTYDFTTHGSPFMEI